MASLSKTKKETYYIQLSPGEDPRRPKIILGRLDREDAEVVLGHIETLLSARKNNLEVSELSKSKTIKETVRWVNNLPMPQRKRLVQIGLIEARGEDKIALRWTVSAFIDDYIKSRTDVKDGTRRRMRDAEKKLNVFFRDDPIESVTVDQAKRFKIHLKTVCKLSENTARRQIGIARQFFNAAIDAGHIEKNPFLGQPVSVRPNEARFFYVTPEMAQKVLDACPDAQWRLIFGLARFGGLRCPSEILRLTWEDIDFEHDRFTVHSTKTEHHADSGIRTVPMFPELRPLFQDVFDQAEPGTIYCITRYRDTGVNLRTQLTRIIKRAGLDRWPKLFQNCRSTRETELFKMTEGNIKAVCSWIGNSPAVALEHYAQTTEADLREAAKMAVLGSAETMVQKTVQHTMTNECNGVQDEKENIDITPDDCSSKTPFAPTCIDTQNP